VVETAPTVVLVGRLKTPILLASSDIQKNAGQAAAKVCFLLLAQVRGKKSVLWTLPGVRDTFDRTPFDGVSRPQAVHPESILTMTKGFRVDEFGVFKIGRRKAPGLKPIAFLSLYAALKGRSSTVALAFVACPKRSVQMRSLAGEHRRLETRSINL